RRVSPSASPGSTTTSTSPPRARSSAPGNGRRWRSCRISSCPSSDSSIATWWRSSAIWWKPRPRKDAAMPEPLKTHDIDAATLQRLTACVMETDRGTIKIALFPDAAPNTVANWHKLASDGFYDDLTFHRVIPGFVAQGGCPHGTGTGGPGWRIACETKGNPPKHPAGPPAMGPA